MRTADDLATLGALAGVDDEISRLEDEESWPDRRPLDSLHAPDDLPLELIPEPFRAWIVDIAERMGVPIGFVAIPALVAFGSLVGRQLGVRPIRFDDWYEPPNLWGAIVAEPGMLKSPAQAEALRPLTEIAKTERERFSATYADYRTRRDGADDEVARIENELKRSRKHGDTALLEGQLREARRALEDEPRQRHHVVNDTTTEKLAVLLQDCPSILQARDELSGFLATMDKPGREDARAFYLEAWAGKHPFSVHRIGRGSINLDAVCLSILGTIQPGPFRELVSGATSGMTAADGLLQRFQLLAVLPAPLQWRHIDRTPDLRARERAQDVFRKAEALDAIALRTEAGPIPLLRFNGEAQALFDEWRNELEKRVRSEAEIPAFRAFLAKMRKTVPTLALLFHLAEVLDSGNVGPISKPAIITACAWSEILESHARWLYEPRRVVAARELAQRIERGRVTDGMTTRAIVRHGWSGLSSRESLDGALSELEAAGWLRVEGTSSGQRGGRTSEFIRLHPTLRNST